MAAANVAKNDQGRAKHRCGRLWAGARDGECPQTGGAAYVRGVLPALLVMLVLGALPGTASAQSFTLVPRPAPGAATRAQGVSANGTIVAGAAYASDGAGMSGWTWTGAGGRNDFGSSEPGAPPYSGAFGISGDGESIVGETGDIHGPSTLPYVYRGPGTFQTLPLLGLWARRGRATDASYDGSVVVGYNDDGNDAGHSLAFRWTAAGGTQSLGALPGDYDSEGYAVSADGNTIVGASAGSSGWDHAFAWTPQTGMQALAGPIGTDARGVSSDARFIVGNATEGFGQPSQAYIWREGVPQGLGFVLGIRQSAAFAVSDDGSVVVGQAFGSRDAAFIWTPQTGMMELKVYLRTLGIDLPSTVNPYMATGISADGMTIVGYTLNPGQAGAIKQGFVLTIPAPGVLTGAVLGIVVAATPRRRR